MIDCPLGLVMKSSLSWRRGNLITNHWGRVVLKKKRGNPTNELGQQIVYESNSKELSPALDVVANFQAGTAEALCYT